MLECIWIMNKLNRYLYGLGLLNLASCNINHSNLPNSEVRSPDLSLDWDSKTLSEAIDRARKGDIDSARQLSIYYEGKNNKQESKKWEDWLIRAGDKDTIQYRRETLNLADHNTKE